MNFSRQSRLWNPEEQRTHLAIIGVGSTGSFISLTLAKMGFKDIDVYDFDKVEEHNIPNQFYRINDNDKPKVEALKEIIKDFSNIDINIKNTKIDKDNEITLKINSIVVVCVDNMEARKLIYEQIKEYPIKLLDTRMGGEGFSIYVVDLANDEEKEKYEKSLDLETKETSCGEKAIIYTILSIASETCNIIKMIDKGEEFPKILKREMKSYRFLGGLK